MPAPRLPRPGAALAAAAAFAAALLATPAAAQGGAAGLVSAPIADVAYEVAFDSARADRRSVGVRMTFTVRGDGPVVLSLPAWTPGAYEISNFARWVSSFAAAGDGGRPLAWDKADFDSWRVHPAGARRVTVSFDYRADTLDNAMAWSRADFLFFNGTNLFLYPEGRPLDRHAATVRVATEPGWRVATGMTPLAAPNTFGERSYHDLVDMPFFVGRFDVDSVEVSGRWTRLATYPSGSVTGARRATALDWLRRVIPPQTAVFGEAPWQSYTVLQIVDRGYGGASGLEHQNSHVDIIGADALDDPFVPSLYAHEIFHAFNVKRLRPAELVPYRYDAAQPTPLLWVSEGITDYYADLAQLRGGVIDSAQFLAATTAKLAGVAALPPVALEDASLSTWIHPADGTGYVYYDKGSLAGLVFDILIRDASDNRRSLDTVLRELYGRTYKRGGRGFTTRHFLEAANRAAGRDLADAYRRYVDGREPYPWATVLPLAGLRYVADTTREARVGLSTRGDSTAVIVLDVTPGGVAAAAGVRVGDELLSLGDVPVRDRDFGLELRRRYASRDGAPLPIVVRRLGRTLTLPATLRLTVRVAERVVADPSAGAKAARVRDGIFRGVTGDPPAGGPRVADGAGPGQRGGCAITAAHCASTAGSGAP